MTKNTSVNEIPLKLMYACTFYLKLVKTFFGFFGSDTDYLSSDEDTDPAHNFITRAVDLDPHSFSLLDPDLGG